MRDVEMGDFLVHGGPARRAVTYLLLTKMSGSLY